MNDSLTIQRKNDMDFCGEVLFTYKLITTEPTEFLRVDGMNSPELSRVFSALIIRESDTIFGYEYETKFIYDISRNQTDAETILRRLAERNTDIAGKETITSEEISALLR